MDIAAPTVAEGDTGFIGICRRTPFLQIWARLDTAHENLMSPPPQFRADLWWRFTRDGFNGAAG